MNNYVKLELVEPPVPFEKEAATPSHHAILNYLQSW